MENKMTFLQALIAEADSAKEETPIDAEVTAVEVPAKFGKTFNSYVIDIVDPAFAEQVAALENPQVAEMYAELVDCIREMHAVVAPDLDLGLEPEVEDDGEGEEESEDGEAESPRQE